MKTSRILRSAHIVSVCGFWVASLPAVYAQKPANLSPNVRAARNQTGEFVVTQTPAALPGNAHTLADTRHALQTMDAIFAAYARAPQLSPPRGFELIHNSTADARDTSRGWPIPVTTGFILLPYDSTKRSPDGRFLPEAEGPVLGGIEVNKIDCLVPRIQDWGNGAFYYLPAETGTVHGWPQYGNTVFMSRRTLPRWLPASAERILNAQLEKARIDQKSALGTDSLRPQNTYETWMKGKEQRLRDYQKTHDELAKIDKKQADEFLARMLQFEEQNAKSMLAMAKQGGGLNQMVNDVQARANKTLQDLEARLRSLSPEQRAASAYIYLALDGVFPLGQVVQPGTAGATAVVYPNPDFYDHTLPAWEAQSICVNLSTGPASKGHYLYPTIVSIWNSLDWDAIANVMK